MKIPAALISAGVGAVFFAVASLFYYQPSFISDYGLDTILTNNHAKARAAVLRLLFNPASAEFGALRSVRADAAKFVCGNVNAKDKSGVYAGYRAFVYTVAIDFARIDDNEQIAQKHDAFKPCPLSAEEKLANSTFKAALDNEGEWRSDRPPAAWPVFPPDHPLSKPAQKRTTAQAMALAKEVEEHWAQFKAGNSKARPSPDDIREALRAQLAIDPKDEGFPQAWAAFVRLRKIERDVGA